jgi:hypothetical protein
MVQAWGGVLMDSMPTLAPLSTSPNAHSRAAVHGQTQHLNGMPYGIGPLTSETALPNSSEGLEQIVNAQNQQFLSFELLKSGKEVELHDLYTDWTRESD